MEENTQVEPTLIDDAEAVVLNQKMAGVAGSFFRALSGMSDEEIYALAFTDAGKDSPRLLEIVNGAFSEMLAIGGDLPRGHFNHYKKLVANFSETLVFNLDSKFEANLDTLIAKAIGKTEFPDKISHNDVIEALSK